MINLKHPINNISLKATKEGLVDDNNKVIYPLKNGAYRLAGDTNYTDNFGKQWNKFKRTQIDKYSGSGHSELRFFEETEWDKVEMDGQNVLEVGSGAGRFSQIVLDHTNANLFSVDYSSAVEANFNNNGPNSRLRLFQASVYEMPFEKGSFDKVFCLGVLQHTPDVKKSVESLIDMVKPGGQLVVDFYPYNGWWTKLNGKYMLRPFLKNMNHDKLMKLIDKHVDWMFSLSRFFEKIGIAKITNRFIPIVGYDTFPSDLPKEQIREWCVLDTFDMFSPAYDQPQKVNDIVKYFKDKGMKNVWGGRVSFNKNNYAMVVRGTK